MGFADNAIVRSKIGQHIENVEPLLHVLENHPLMLKRFERELGKLISQYFKDVGIREKREISLTEGKADV